MNAAWVEKSAVEDARIDDLGAGLGELGAHDHRQQAAEQEEEEGRDDVLDPDHLVIGVELEVVPPASSAPCWEWSSGIVGAPEAQRNQ